MQKSQIDLIKRQAIELYPELEGKEFKTLNVALDVTAVTEDPDYWYLKGYGSIFGNKDLGGDVVVKGAFSAWLKRVFPTMNFMHEEKNIVGAWDVAREDDKGLWLEGRIPKGTLVDGKDLGKLLKIKAYKGLSIGYFTIDAEMEYETDTFFLKELFAYEVSIVGTPMNLDAEITDFKNLDTITIENVKEMTKRQFETILRESGFSKKAAEYATKSFGHGEHVAETSGNDDLTMAKTLLNELKTLTKE